MFYFYTFFWSVLPSQALKTPLLGFREWPQILLNLTWLCTKASQTFTRTFPVEPDLALHRVLPDFLRNLLRNPVGPDSGSALHQGFLEPSGTFSGTFLNVSLRCWGKMCFYFQRHPQRKPLLDYIGCVQIQTEALVDGCGGCGPGWGSKEGSLVLRAAWPALGGASSSFVNWNSYKDSLLVLNNPPCYLCYLIISQKPTDLYDMCCS